jgi:hypothetical protein
MKKLPISTGTHKPFRQPTEQNIDFVENDHDKLISDEGANILYETSVKCPCRTVYKNKSHSDCVNCGGVGFVYVNPIKTRALVTSQGKKQKYSPSGENMGDGDIAVTPFSNIVMCEMDRFTLYDSLAVVTETPLTYYDYDRNCLVAKFTYPIIKIDLIFQYINYKVRLESLTEEGYDVENNFIYFKNITSSEPINISVRYKYRPVYIINKILRHVRDIQIVDGFGTMRTKVYPQQLEARILHNLSNYTDNINSNEENKKL